MVCENCKRLQNALNVSEFNRDKAEKLNHDQARTINDLRTKLENKSSPTSVNGKNVLS